MLRAAHAGILPEPPVTGMIFLLQAGQTPWRPVSVLFRFRDFICRKNLMNPMRKRKNGFRFRMDPGRGKTVSVTEKRWSILRLSRTLLSTPKRRIFQVSNGRQIHLLGKFSRDHSKFMQRFYPQNTIGRVSLQKVRNFSGRHPMTSWISYSQDLFYCHDYRCNSVNKL